MYFIWPSCTDSIIYSENYCTCIIFYSVHGNLDIIERIKLSNKLEESLNHPGWFSDYKDRFTKFLEIKGKSLTPLLII